VIASFLVNMLFLNIKSGLFIIRLFFPTVLCTVKNLNERFYAFPCKIIT
jgi:hypothetical protein